MSEKYLAMMREQERECRHLAPVWGLEHEAIANDWAAMREWVEGLEARLRESTELLRGIQLDPYSNVKWRESVVAQIAANEAAMGGK